MDFKIKDTFRNELVADKDRTNQPREVLGAHFSLVHPLVPPAPELILLNESLALELGFTEDFMKSSAFVDIFSGTKIVENTEPYAMNYGGHQFGHWAGQLGDGRAINLFEIEHRGTPLAFQLKGAGVTPYSRQGDGRAVLRSSIREHLCSEAMYALGVPTTRSLSLMLSGDKVLRDKLYDGHPEYEKGAIICRVSPTFIRFGHFELFAARRDMKHLKLLADYTIRHFYSHIKGFEKEHYLQFFSDIVKDTLQMIVEWQRVGFVHGVMNTDNMSILGLTIDYGPYGWIDAYDTGWTPNTTDRAEKRYRFGYQPNVALWNLVQLANALYPLIEDVEAMESILNAFQTDYVVLYEEMMARKLGLSKGNHSDIIKILEVNLEKIETDMTIFFRNLSEVNKDESSEHALECVKESFYSLEQWTDEIEREWLQWFESYLNHLRMNELSDEERKMKMNQVNPKYVLRNYMAQMVIERAEKEDYQLLNEISELLKHPYDEQPEYQKWYAKRPEWARNKVGSSMLSCSS